MKIIFSVLANVTFTDWVPFKLPQITGVGSLVCPKCELVGDMSTFYIWHANTHCTPVCKTQAVPALLSSLLLVVVGCFF